MEMYKLTPELTFKKVKVLSISNFVVKVEIEGIESYINMNEFNELRPRKRDFISIVLDGINGRFL